MTAEEDPSFRDAVDGLLKGDFSRLEPLFLDAGAPPRQPCRIIQWYELGYFKEQPIALAEALACACFNGRTDVARHLLEKGVDPSAGNNTGLNAFHWAVNRGKLDTVGLLIEQRVPLEQRSTYDGTVLGTAVWSAVHEPCTDHLPIIEALIRAGARLKDAGYPSGDVRVDEVLRRHGAKRP